MSGAHGAAPGFPGGPWLDELVAAALREDVGPGDVTTAIAVEPGAVATARLRARSPGVVAGLPLAAAAWGALSPQVRFSCVVGDGTAVAAGDDLAEVSGPAAAILTGERVALNFLQHLSGIATLTARYVAEVAGTACRVLDTRKTVPGYRLLAKYAVRCGGGANHRLGLYDRVLLKDNHWSAGVPVEAMVARARDLAPGIPIEVEVDTPAQLGRVLPLGVEWIMLDNFAPADVARAVAMRDAAAPSTLLEVSGNVTLETIGAHARAGADAASVGRLTHSAPALDIGLDLEPA